MNIFEKMDSTDIFWTIISLLASITLISCCLIVSSCQNQELQQYLDAGCERDVNPVSKMVEWVNCNKANVKENSK